MDKNEKILLLQLILEDIRGNWAFGLKNRCETALELAKELELQDFVGSINEYIQDCKDGYNDGRFFRTSYKRGGYEGMEILHGLNKTIMDKSQEFKNSIDVLTYPEYRFEDYWNEYS